MKYSYELMEKLHPFGAKGKLAVKLGISRPTLNRWISRFEDETKMREYDTMRSLLFAVNMTLEGHGTSIKDLAEAWEDVREAKGHKRNKYDYYSLLY